MGDKNSMRQTYISLKYLDNEEKKDLAISGKV